ncbi:uncharacterized protein LOC129610084 [Condylostylus longicornis]|uniref:uncharacterized protein LOC129610084 n=1 Tax=Condylostylus longicornis TaxID=2530218 RepID=UPI00244DD425|nr:uncharacterized protein LOC129610084 [Condylostylus longicornis]
MTESKNTAKVTTPTGQNKKIVYFAVGPKSNSVHCPFCDKNGETIVSEKVDSWESVNSCLQLTLCCCPIIFISALAYLVPCFKIRQHYCSKCGEYLGTYRRPKL